MDKTNEMARKCPECGSDSPAGMRFCGQCGAALPILCPACGAENPREFRFCGQCGEDLGESEEPVAAPAADAAAAQVAVPEIALQDLIEIVEEPAAATPLEDLIEIVEEEAQELAEDVVEDLIREQAPAHLTCEVCGMVNPPDATHCELCGAVVVPAGAPCPACGFPNKAGSLFCDNCGERLGLTDLL